MSYDREIPNHTKDKHPMLKQDKTTGIITEELTCVHAILFLDPLPPRIQNEIKSRTETYSLPSVDFAGSRLLLFRNVEDMIQWENACRGLLSEARTPHISFRLLDHVSGVCDQGTSQRLRQLGLVSYCTTS
jgi:hypothetical protein